MLPQSLPQVPLQFRSRIQVLPGSGGIYGGGGTTDETSKPVQLIPVSRTGTAGRAKMLRRLPLS
jgi:hypothetical protein